ncbi:hypothetical protein [Chrysiogenes arsenatis]|uniref:hypothetical protein n=1 Tax=Chrysiogenes arsenatis TaxID=309797 RepID=UPI00146FB3AA|nr:hypothetical protein [Chrysiogenes arsenatis]
MPKAKLDSEEQELLEAYESGSFKSDLDADRREYLAKALHKYVSGGFNNISANG